MPIDVKITKTEYANVVLPFIGPAKIFKYLLDNGFMSVGIINYGATVVSINMPNSRGVTENIILGYDDIAGYLNTKNPYLGATIGRYGHHIAGAAFSLNHQNYYLSKNDGNHTYHGGVQGFDKKIWSHRIEESSVVMTYRSYDLEEGFPADLYITARFILTNENQFIVVYRAIPSNMTTPVNIMNQMYFNLSGDGTSNISQHQIKIFSEFRATMVEDEFIPTGETEELAGSPQDLRRYTLISELMETANKEPTVSDTKIGKTNEMAESRSTHGAFDMKERTVPSVAPTDASSCQRKAGTFYCIEGMGVRPHAKLKLERSGRAVHIFSDQPCTYVSIGNELVEAPASRGKWGCNAGVLLQTGNFPDAVHQDAFPSPWVHPKATYQHTILYKFRVSELDCSDEEDGLQRPPEPTMEELRNQCLNINKESNPLKNDAEDNPPGRI